MQLSESEKMLLETINRGTKQRRDTTGYVPQSIRTSSLLLSKPFLEMFEANQHGFWCFGVYVELEPAFSTQTAKEWQL